MSIEITGNYLRAHRRRRGLSQRELGILVGYKNGVQVLRHERSKNAPPFVAAVAYEIVFQTPASSIFVGFRSAVERMVEENIQELRKNVLHRTEGRPASGPTLQKLQWLTEQSSE